MALLERYYKEPSASVIKTDHGYTYKETGFYKKVKARVGVAMKDAGHGKSCSVQRAVFCVRVPVQCKFRSLATCYSTKASTAAAALWLRLAVLRVGAAVVLWFQWCRWCRSRGAGMICCCVWCPVSPAARSSPWRSHTILAFLAFSPLGPPHPYRCTCTCAPCSCQGDIKLHIMIIYNYLIYVPLALVGTSFWKAGPGEYAFSLVHFGVLVYLRWALVRAATATHYCTPVGWPRQCCAAARGANSCSTAARGCCLLLCKVAWQAPHASARTAWGRPTKDGGETVQRWCVHTLARAVWQAAGVHTRARLGWLASAAV